MLTKLAMVQQGTAHTAANANETKLWGALQDIQKAAMNLQNSVTEAQTDLAQNSGLNDLLSPLHEIGKLAVNALTQTSKAQGLMIQLVPQITGSATPEA